MICLHPWKYVFNFAWPSELYDLETDPGELHNLCSNPGLRDLRVQLHRELREWMTRTNDPAHARVPEITPD